MFANTSTQICHNCDHKDEYIEELEAEIEECRAAVEKQKAMKVTHIHVDEYHCPACGSENTTNEELTVGDHYCQNCGQRLE